MGLYSAVINGIAATAAQDIFEIVAPSDAKVRINRIFVGQYTDFGDAQDELIPIEVIRGYETGGSGGGTITPAPFNPYVGAASAVVERNNTTVASDSGSDDIDFIAGETFNVRAGYLWKAPDALHFMTRQQWEETQLILKPSQRLVVNIGAPADSITLNATLEFEELR